MQYKGENLLSVVYFSKLLSDAEKNYTPLKLKLYANYKTITTFKYYLYNRKFLILSDAKSFEKYKRSSSPANIPYIFIYESI